MWCISLHLMSQHLTLLLPGIIELKSKEKIVIVYLSNFYINCAARSDKLLLFMFRQPGSSGTSL